MISVFGIGNPLLDFIVPAGFELLQTVGATPGTMNLTDNQRMNKILGLTDATHCLPGGSCANTIRGLAWLGSHPGLGPPVYCGAVGDDAIGSRYIRELEDLGIRAAVGRTGDGTGVSIVVVTPDRERTMFTYLGACREFTIGNIDFGLLQESRYLHFVGYMWDTQNQRNAVEESARFVKRHGGRVSFDLADTLVVQRNREYFLSWIPANVDVLFGNRQELSLLTGESGADRLIMQRAGTLAEIVVMKVGPKGCYIGQGSTIESVPAKSVSAVDTTGAGDAFAAGFLHGILSGRNSTTAAESACRLAANVVTVEGCDYSALPGANN